MLSDDISRRLPMPRPLLMVKLQSGRRIAAVQLHVGFTYGTYTRVFTEKNRLNEINLELLWNEYPAKVLWERKFPSLLLRRDEHQAADKRSLPVYKVTSLFESEPLDPGQGRLSALVVNWLQDTAKPVLSAVNRKALCGIDWESMAKDFN